jgi:mannose/fructose/N-acetylgalactosamine-specific phosphotransferase system component IIC
MSKQKEIEVVESGRSVEPWIAILLASLVPLVAAVMLPESWRVPLYVVGGVLCAVGIALLLKQEIGRMQHRSPHDDFLT